MNERDKLISELIKEKGGSREDYLSVLNKIAFHESAGTMDPTIKQYGGGPGRGKYQFEIGKNEGAITAARRTKRYLAQKGMEVPAWLEQATSGDSLDASTLTAEQQDVLFLGNMRMHPKADIGKVVNGHQPIEDFWANYHWAGSKDERANKISSFKDSIQRYASVRQPVRKEFNMNATKKVTADQRQEAIAVQDNIPAPEEIPQPKQWLPIQNKVQQPQQVADNNQYAPKPILDTSIYKGVMDYVSTKNKFNEFNAGGKHEQNPLGGVPIGMGANGLPNTVEEGETSYSFGDDTFVFSDRISLNDKALGKNFNQPKIDNSFALGGNTDPTDPRLKTKKAKESTNVAKPVLKNTELYPIGTNKRKQEYYNPAKPNIVTGDDKLDLLYKNDWLMDVPVVEDMIKDKAKSYAMKSQGKATVDRKYIDANDKEANYTGEGFDNIKVYNRPSLIDQYFKDGTSLPKSKYKPSSDYLEFLPSYSVKGNFDKLISENNIVNQEQFQQALSEVISDEFFENKKTITKTIEGQSQLAKLLNLDLGAHKVGAAWDDEVGLPYISLSDAWDFEPKHYSEKWSGAEADNYDQATKEEKDRAYQQSYLMHKAGNPFKIYDRFYFDPDTREYISEPKKYKSNSSTNQLASGGFTDPTDPRLKIVKSKDNTTVAQNKIGMKAQLQEEKAAALDLLEMKQTGTINQPKSVRYKHNPSEQRTFKQDNLSHSERKHIESVMSPSLTTDRLGVYLADPNKITGDALNAVGINNSLPNTEQDRLDINASRLRGENTWERYGDYMPDVAINGAFGAAFAPSKGLNFSKVLNETVNPLANLGIIDDLLEKTSKFHFRSNPKLTTEQKAKHVLREEGAENLFTNEVKDDTSVSYKLGRKKLGDYFTNLKSRVEKPFIEQYSKSTTKLGADAIEERLAENPQTIDGLNAFMKRAAKEVGNPKEVVEKQIRTDLQALADEKYGGNLRDIPWEEEKFLRMAKGREYMLRLDDNLNEIVKPQLEKYIGLQKEYFAKPNVAKKLKDIGVDPEDFAGQLDNLNINVTANPRQGASYSSAKNQININATDFEDSFNGVNPYSNWRTTIDHELGHAMQGSRGKSLTQQLRREGKFKMADHYRYEDIYPTKLDEVAGVLKSDYKAIPEEGLDKYAAERNFQDVSDIASDPTWSYSYFENGGRNVNTYGALTKLERLAHLREMKTEMINSGIMKEMDDEVTMDMIREFKKKVPKNRIMQFATDNDKNFNYLRQLLNKTPIITGAIATGAALKNED